MCPHTHTHTHTHAHTHTHTHTHTHHYADPYIKYRHMHSGVRSVCPFECVLCTCIRVSIKQFKRPLILFSISIPIETDFCILCVFPCCSPLKVCFSLSILSLHIRAYANIRTFLVGGGLMSIVLIILTLFCFNIKLF